MKAPYGVSRPLHILAFGLLAFQTMDLVFGSGCAPDNLDISVSSAEALNISSATFSASELQSAASYWSGCSGYGSKMPTLQVGGSGGIPVNVSRMAGSSPTGRCGIAHVMVGATSHRVVSVDITIYTQQNNGAGCQPLTDEIAHELGHALGLDDADSASCQQHIMGFRTAGTTRSVSAEDCDQVDQDWQLPGEPSSGGGGTQGPSPPPCI